MTGTICLQGGNEFTLACRTMDEAWLGRVGRRRTCVAPLACPPGPEYRMAADNGATYLHALGVDDVRMAPEPNLSVDAAVHAIVDADIVFIPGGSPARARRRAFGTAIGAALRAHVAAGGTVVGASAGAMLLGEHMLVPGDDMHVRPGLGLVPDVLVLPHYGGSRMPVLARVVEQVGDIATILGVPSCCGVLFADGGDSDPAALGAQTCWRIAPGSDPTPIPAADGQR